MNDDDYNTALTDLWFSDVRIPEPTRAERALWWLDDHLKAVLLFLVVIGGFMRAVFR